MLSSLVIYEKPTPTGESTNKIEYSVFQDVFLYYNSPEARTIYLPIP